MRLEAKNLVEAIGVSAVANTAVWTAQDLSIWVQIILGAVSIYWILVQSIRFTIEWFRKEREKNAKEPE